MPEGLIRTARELFFAALTGEATDIEPWVIDRAISVLDEEDLPAGTRIFAAGELPEFIYFMREGRVGMLRDGAAPWTFEGRWAIGMFDAVLERPHDRTAVALTNLRLMKLRAEHWLELIEESFDLARAVVTNTLRTIASLETRCWRLRPKPQSFVVATAPTPGLPLTFVDRLAYLMDVPMIRDAGVQVLANVAGMLDETVFEPGEHLYLRGVATGRTFLVIEGKVVGDRSDPDLSVVFGPGTVVCGVAGLGEPAIAWEARAVERTRTLSMRLEDWFDLMEEHFDLVRSTLRSFARLRENILGELAADAGDLLVP
jgi:CRP-like cAMP-binding protein